MFIIVFIMVKILIFITYNPYIPNFSLKDDIYILLTDQVGISWRLHVAGSWQFNTIQVEVQYTIHNTIYNTGCRWRCTAVALLVKPNQFSTAEQRVAKCSAVHRVLKCTTTTKITVVAGGGGRDAIKGTKVAKHKQAELNCQYHHKAFHPSNLSSFQPSNLPTF